MIQNCKSTQSVRAVFAYLPVSRYRLSNGNFNRLYATIKAFCRQPNHQDKTSSWRVVATTIHSVGFESESEYMSLSTWVWVHQDWCNKRRGKRRPAWSGDCLDHWMVWKYTSPCVSTRMHARSWTDFSLLGAEGGILGGFGSQNREAAQSRGPQVLREGKRVCRGNSRKHCIWSAYCGKERKIHRPQNQTGFPLEYNEDQEKCGQEESKVRSLGSADSFLVWNWRSASNQQNRIYWHAWSEDSRICWLIVALKLMVCKQPTTQDLLTRLIKKSGSADSAVELNSCAKRIRSWSFGIDACYRDSNTDTLNGLHWKHARAVSDYAAKNRICTCDWGFDSDGVRMSQMKSVLMKLKNRLSRLITKFSYWRLSGVYRFIRFV